MKELPETIFVEIACPGTLGEYLIADTSIDGFNEGALIGEYTLTTINHKRVIPQLDTVISKRNKTK